MKKITGLICACTAVLAVATTSASALTSDAPAVTPESASQPGETRAPTPLERAIRDMKKVAAAPAAPAAPAPFTLQSAGAHPPPTTPAGENSNGAGE